MNEFVFFCLSKGITTYFSGNCCLEDAELAQRFLDSKVQYLDSSLYLQHHIFLLSFFAFSIFLFCNFYSFIQLNNIVKTTNITAIFQGNQTVILDMACIL